MQITILSTSARKGSNTLKAAKALKKIIEKNGHSVNLLSFEAYDIPMIGQGSLNKNELTDFQEELIDAWEKAQVVFMAVPEYNWMISGQIVNTLHQLGNPDFGHLFEGKVFAMMGVSTGRGGRLPALELTILVNKLISFLNKMSVVSPKLFESHETAQNVDEEGNLQNNTLYNKGIEDFVAYTLRIAGQWFGD